MDMAGDRGETHDDIVARVLAAADVHFGPGLPPIRPALCAVVADPAVMSRVPGDWWVVQIQPQREAEVRGDIARAGMPVYAPRVPGRVRHGRGSWRDVARPMFPGYCFVRATTGSGHWHAIATARGVVRVLGERGRPRPLADDAISAIRLAETEINASTRRSEVVWHFAPGDVARVTDGPFAAFVAAIVTAVDAAGRIRALVDVFGRKTMVTLAADHLEAL